MLTWQTHFSLILLILLEKLASYAHEEASKACGVYEDLQGIKDTLSIVKCVLIDAEDKKDRNHGLHEWLKQIQNICFNAEDVLDDRNKLLLINLKMEVGG